jgi:hypothetical protein
MIKEGKGMVFEKLSKRKVALTIGLGIILIAIIAPIAEFAILSENIDTGDMDLTEKNLEENQDQILVAFLIYVVIFLLEIFVSSAIYFYFRSINKRQAKVAAGLRLGFTLITGVGLVGLLLPSAQLYIYGQLLAYALFIPHILVLGYLSFHSGDVPKWIGGTMMVGSFCYIFLTYGEYLISGSLYEILFMVTMIPAVVGELSFAIWMLIRGGKKNRS